MIQAAAEGLGDLERLESVTPLMEAYESVESAGDKGCHTRITIVRALGQIGAATAEPIIRRALNAIQIETVGSGREDTALDLRAHAAFALTRVDPENAIHDLALMLFDSEPNVDVHRAAIQQSSYAHGRREVHCQSRLRLRGCAARGETPIP